MPQFIKSPKVENTSRFSPDRDFQAMCGCGCGREISDRAWLAAGAPAATECHDCGAGIPWKRLTLKPLPVHRTPASPLQAVVLDLMQHPGELWGGLTFAMVISVLLVTGWLGRILGVLAIIYSSLPPGATH